MNSCANDSLKFQKTLNLPSYWARFKEMLAGGVEDQKSKSAGWLEK